MDASAEIKVSNSQDDITKTQTSKFRNTQKRIQRICISISAFIFSRIGMSLVVVAYALAGGFMFKAVESPTEHKDLDLVIHKKQMLVEYLLKHTQETSALVKEEWIENVSKQLYQFQSDIITSVRQRGYVGSISGNQLQGNETYANEQWNIAGAILYAVTVITSIGYGNITCKTALGRTLTMIYALIGIPLMLVFLAIVGSSFADAFRFTYGRLCSLYCQIITGNSLEDKMSSNVPIFVTLSLLASYIFLGAILFSQWEEWTLLDGAYFCFITLSTIGLGDLVPGRSLSARSSMESSKNSSADIKLVLCSLYLTIGLSLLVMCFNLVEQEVRAKFRRIGIRLGIVDIQLP